ncbi:uncharacterized protein Triagg1_598 [Trichoderma aggressivum f. europaeum]|uniref:NACHT domain-containing protein n=1 Tax=Trichoderma aggressivum f. europaeum TaxID=173218 RepID=A0AAE1ILM2_9HYPO|nr:hypothetical protein Triagg1_598 [Trichoderma aggressivum f. europaeum]
MDDKSQKRQLGEQLLHEAAEHVVKKPRVGSFDTGRTSHFSGQGIQLAGHGDFNVYKGNVNIATTNAAPTTEAGNCLRDLFTTDPSDDRTAMKRKKGNRATGTCEWILETEELTAWLGQGQTSNVLWLYGNPGTGKSTMAIFLTEQLSTIFSATEGKTLAYFFCDSSFDKRKTATSVVRGLLLQLVQQHPNLIDYILPKYNERGKDLFQSFDALWAIFMAVATDQKTGQKYCVIDALDECDQESQKVLLQQFQETFHSQDAPSNVQIFVTSRPYSEIREYLDEFTNKDLASFSQAKKDIDQCIEERVADLVKKKHYTAKVKEQVSNILRNKAENTFLWVGLACEELKEVPSKDAVKVLQNMPKGLHSLYETLLNTAQEESGTDILRHILSLVAVCMRPLSVLELSEACQLYEEEVDIETRVQFTRDQIASCRLMIIVQDEKVLLLHQSVKDYLVGTNSRYFIDELEAHANIVHRCVSLLMEEFHRREQSRMHFISYAIERWPDHARMAQLKFEVRDSEAEFFQVNSPSREHWLKALLHDRLWDNDITAHMSILHIAGRWGIAPLVDYITACNQNYPEETDAKRISSIDVNCVDSHNATPIEMAAKWGSISVISKLLCLGAEINEYVVAAAAKNNRNGEEVMTLLLDQRGDQITITEYIVKAAARNSKTEVMALLLDRRRDEITITKSIVKTAARHSKKEVMALLLDRGGDQIIITEDIAKAAAINYNKEVMALLFDRCGHQITITNDIVKAAAGNYHSKEVMALLLGRYGDQIAITEDILTTAATNGGEGNKIMTLLFDQCGDQIIITEDIVKAAAGNPRKGKEILALLFRQCREQIIITEDVLKAAAGNWEEAETIMTLLFDQCGDQIIITEDIVKVAASNRGKGKEVMALLLERYKDQIAITNSIITSVVLNEENSKEIIQLLLDQCGNQITITELDLETVAENSGGGQGVLALLLGHCEGQIDIVEDIVIAAARNMENGKEVMAVLLDWFGDEITITEDVINAAVTNEKSGKEVMALLLDRCGCQIAITDDVIEAAAVCGQTEMLNLFSQRNFFISDWDKWHDISRFYDAARSGYVHIIKQLLDRGVNPDLKNDLGHTPLSIAAWYGHEAVVKVLAERIDVDINSRTDLFRETPLMLAASENFERTVAILLDAGANPKLKNRRGHTASTIARRSGYEKIVDILEKAE